MRGIERRLEALEGRIEPPESPRRAEARAMMKAHLDEISAARREGRPIAPETVAVFEAIERRRGREPA
jgi:hypothetical protein